MCGVVTLLHERWLSDQQGCVDEPSPSSGTNEVVYEFRPFRSALQGDISLFRFSTSQDVSKSPLGERKGTVGPGRP